jgi:integrase
LDAQGALFLRRAKTGVPVFVPLPPLVVSSLRALPSANAAYFFWSGNGDPRSAVQGYERSFRKLFRITNLRNPDGSPKWCHTHMFRDTFAVELLLAGIPIDLVSVLLGHRSIKMTEKHYLPWVKARQDQLTISIKRAWFPEAKKDLMPFPNSAWPGYVKVEGAREMWTEEG